MKIFLLLSALRLYKGQASKVSTPSNKTHKQPFVCLFFIYYKTEPAITIQKNLCCPREQWNTTRYVLQSIPVLRRL